MNLLHLSLGILLSVLAQALLDLFLQALDGLAAGVSHRHLGVLGLTLALLHELLAPLLRERGYADAYHLAVVLGSDAEV